MAVFLAALIALAPSDQASPTTIVESETFDLTGWLEPDGWECVSPEGADRLRIKHQWSGEPTLLIYRWQNEQPLETFRSSCGPDFIAGSPTVSDLTSDLCDSWRLYLKLDEGSTTRATLDLDWKGEKLRGYRCEREPQAERG